MNTALITGASSGIALALARELRQQGWKLALVGRDVERLDASLGHLHCADVSTEAGAQQAVASATAELGAAPDAVINCAGSTLIAPISRTSEAQYRAVMAANLDTAFFVGKAYAAALSLAQVRQGGSLLLFSSVVAGIGVANHAAIAAAKGGVEALTRALAADFSGIGMRVNCIAPGLTRSPMTERMLGSEAGARQIAAQYPLGRHGEAADAAALAAFLVSPASGWITGQVIGLDGGFSAVRPYVKAG
jgi:NAD(P)-dependent dehydrogenase (short-subunit alcohol dehydrogenase family)